MDFTIDGSCRFTIRINSDWGVTDPQHDISGSPANQVMYTYINRVAEAKRRVKDIEQRKRSSVPATREAAEKEMRQLTEEMTQFEKDYFKDNGKYRFVQLVDMMSGPDVPDEVADKTTYYITHYWDRVDLKDKSLVYTPDLFNKMSLYFFNVLYHADKDTICKYADMVLHRVEDDPEMLRYFLDYIMPRYYRSTKNIGWDATWCYLVRKYYLTGKCSWASPSELNNKNKRFILKNLNENFKFSRYQNSFLWLKNAGVALPTFCVTEPTVPLMLNKSSNLFKLFLSDVGLLAAMYMDGIQLKLLNREKDINFGSVYENAAAQELKAHGYDLYYFNSKKQGELDFIIEHGGNVLPIEIKSGKDYQRHAALDNVMENRDYAIPTAFVFQNDNVRADGRVVYLPIYMLMFLQKEQIPESMIYKLDLSGLQ